MKLANDPLTLGYSLNPEGRTKTIWFQAAFKSAAIKLL